jgi:prepilin-type N-terminal cleavage/methylation domain-containing protein
MNISTGPGQRQAGRGFTLIEILLATVLLLLLLGAIVFNFSSLERGARLDEGASQFESLLRHARAQATSSGRQVQIVFEEGSDAFDSWVVDKVRLTWEPDPLGQPGLFKDLAQTEPFLEHINELVEVESLRLIGPGTSENGVSDSGSGREEEAERGQPDLLPPIRFYPDGSSDSAQIVLLSRDDQDQRRVTLRLLGVTGSIKRLVTENRAGSGTNMEQNVASDLDSRPQGSIEKPKPTAAAKPTPAGPVQTARPSDQAEPIGKVKP